MKFERFIEVFLHRLFTWKMADLAHAQWKKGGPQQCVRKHFPLLSCLSQRKITLASCGDGFRFSCLDQN
jgi:hypothetical protein